MEMRISILILMIAIMSGIQISLWSVLPRSLRDFIMANTLLAFIVNLLGSMFIVAFTGVASMVGTANLGGSIVFLLYARRYKVKHRLNGFYIKWIKILWVVPLIPYISIKRS
jgi:membrane associated rhomboid family serine protease